MGHIGSASEIALYRRQMGVKQLEIARKLRLQRNTLGDIENNRISVSNQMLADLRRVIDEIAAENKYQQLQAADASR